MVHGPSVKDPSLQLEQDVGLAQIQLHPFPKGACVQDKALCGLPAREKAVVKSLP